MAIVNTMASCQYLRCSEIMMAGKKNRFESVNKSSSNSCTSSDMDSEASEHAIPWYPEIFGKYARYINYIL